MPAEVLVDTSVWAAVANDEPRATGLKEMQGQRVAVISSLSWAELASLAQQGRVEPYHVEAMSADCRTELVFQEDCITGGRLHGQMRRQGHPKVSLVDCIIYASARRLGIDLITLDTDLEGLAGVQILGHPAKKA